MVRAARLDPAALPRIEAAAAIVAKAAASDAAVYGINTGFGKLASKRIPAQDTATLQRNLILSHCCGMGEPTPAPVVRLMMALKLLSLGRGASGCAPWSSARSRRFSRLELCRWCPLRVRGRLGRSRPARRISPPP